MISATNPPKLEFFTAEIANQIAFFDKGGEFEVTLFAKSLKQEGKDLDRSSRFPYYKNTEETPTLEKTKALIIQSQINSFIKRIIAKDYNKKNSGENYYGDLVCKIENLSENLNVTFTKTGKVPVDKQKTKVEIITNSLNQEHILSDLESHLDKVYEMDLTKYKFYLECLVNSTSIFFEENPDIDYISIIRNSLWFGVIGGSRIYFKEKILFPLNFIQSELSVNRKQEIAFKTYAPERYSISKFDKEFKPIEHYIKEYEESQKRNRKFNSFGRQNY